MKQRTRQYVVPAIAGAIGIACAVGIFVLNANQAEPKPPVPQRAASAPVESTYATPPAPEEEPAEQEPLVIASSDILHLSIPAIALEAESSGQTWPRQTENCKGGDVCIDPPELDKVALYGDPPSYPSENPVLLFGHTSWSADLTAVFSNLPALVAGDEIVVTTQTGVFSYRAQAPALVPFGDVASSELIYGLETEKLVLVTCNTNMVDATVIVAYLESASLV